MADEKTGGSGRAAEYSPRSENYQQPGHRLAPAFIRDVLENFNQRTLTTAQAVGQLGVSRSRLYVLAAAYLAARTQTAGTLWQPGHSGGDHATPWPQPVLDLLRKRLSCTPPCPYSFVASEALRLHDFKLDRAQVRRWALAHRLAHAVPPKKVRAAVRRWQRHRIGELWQLDASPHRWFPHSQQSCPMLNMLDDCSRLFTGSKLYERELLLSYFDFLPAAFQAHGRHHAALGGLMSGVSAPPSKSPRMDARPSARNASAWKNRPAPSSSSVSTPQATTPSWPPCQTQNPGPYRFSLIVPYKSCPALLSPKKSCFENYAASRLAGVDRLI